MRHYKCTCCGRVADQTSWFPDHFVEIDPLKEGATPVPCTKCRDNLYGQIVVMDVWPADWKDRIRRLEETPANLVEIVEQIPAA